MCWTYEVLRAIFVGLFFVAADVEVDVFISTVTEAYYAMTEKSCRKQRARVGFVAVFGAAATLAVPVCMLFR